MNESLKVRDCLKKSFPVYFSRAMRHEFVHLFGKLTTLNQLFYEKCIVDSLVTALPVLTW